MKNRVASVLLATLLLAGTMSACGQSDSEADSKTTGPGYIEDNLTAEDPAGYPLEEEEAADHRFDAYQSIDLGGRTVRISVSANVSEGGAGMPTSYPYIAGPEETTGESVQDNVYQRNIFVEELLNCSLEYLALDLEFDQVQPYIEKIVTAGDSEADYYVNDQLGLLTCALEGCLLDLADASNFPQYYFEFDSDAYYTDYMTGLSVGSKRFLVTGDYFIDTMRAGHVLYLNRNMYGSLYGNPDGLYEVVLNKQWTIDRFNTIITEAYIDANGNGAADDDDSYGLAIHAASWADPYYVFYYSTASHVVDFDDTGMPYINAANVDTMSRVADLLIQTHQSRGTYKTSTLGDNLKKFVNGQALFAAFSKIGDLEQESIRDFDGIGVVPYPMLDETQDGYRTLVHDTAEMGAFPITTVGEAASAASAVIQVMSVHAHENLLHDYYETALKVKYSQDQYTPQMLDLVVEGIRAPFEFAYEFGFNTSTYLGTITFVPVRDSISQGTNIVASTFQRLTKAAEKGLERLIAAYED